MDTWWSGQWEAVRASFDRESVLAQSKPASVASALAIGLGAIGVPAFVEPLASMTRMRHPWLAMLVFGLGSLASLAFWKVKGRGDFAAALTLVDTTLYVSGASLAIAFSSPPGSYVYAALLGLMMTATQARELSLTLPLALAFCVPSISITALLGHDFVSTFLVAIACAVALWVSYHTGRYRRMKRTQDGLVSALRASNEVADASVELALASTLLGIGNFMHELRNAQSSVSLSLRYLSETLVADDECMAAVRDAAEGHEHAIALTTGTLEELRKRCKPATDRFRLDQVVGGWCASAESQVTSVKGDVVAFEVRGAAADFESILVNLKRNALQAGAKKVTLTWQLEPSAAAVKLKVRDDGPGLPPNREHDVFQPFLTLSRSGGTGLGLYLCRRRVELMGGSISARNAPGGGAEFEILLPGCQVAASPPADGSLPHVAG